MSQSENLHVDFPFFIVSDAQKVFGGIQEMKRTIEDCPQEFKDRNDWYQLASHVHHFGWPGLNLEGVGIYAETTEEAVAKRDYIETWLGSFQPGHDEKMAVVGWLMSLTFSELPQQTDPGTTEYGFYISR